MNNLSKISTNWYVGTSGWNYDDFEMLFYPKGLKPSERLTYYAQQMNSVEINSSFYRIFRKDIFISWKNKTPKNFVFSVKLNRQFTHKVGLNTSTDLFKWFFDSVLGLGEKFRVLLIQLPPRLIFNKTKFLIFITILKRYCCTKISIEPRNQSWFNQEVYDILKEHNIALCLANTGGKYPEYAVKTANFTYVRLHGPKELYSSKYSLNDLNKYKYKINEFNNSENYVYFDNTAYGYAIKNAMQFKDIICN